MYGLARDETKFVKQNDGCSEWLDRKKGDRNVSEKVEKMIPVRRQHGTALVFVYFLAMTILADFMGGARLKKLILFSAYFSHVFAEVC